MQDNNTQPYHSQYDKAFYNKNTLAYDYGMSTLRENLQHEMNIKGWNAYDLSSASGITQPTIHRFLSGKHGELRGSTIIKLAEGLGITEEKLRGFTDNKKNMIENEKTAIYESTAQPPSADFSAIHYVNVRLSAGINGFEIDYHDEIMPPIFFRHDWLKSKGLNPKKLFACQISGYSMEPRLHSGDSVIINTDAINPIDGKVFAVNYEGEMLIKRMYRDGGNWYLRSDNADKTRYPDKLCASDICIIIGEVVHRQSTEI